MSAVSRRYARALFALAKEGKLVDTTAEGLAHAATIAADPTVRGMLDNPLVAPGRRRDLARTVAREVNASPLLTNFICLLADHQRLAALPAIDRHFQALLDQDLGRVRVAIRSAAPLSQPQYNDVVATFTKLTGKQVVPSATVDPDMLGGVVVEAEGKVYDGSVRTHLARLAKAITGSSAL